MLGSKQLLWESHELIKVATCRKKKKYVWTQEQGEARGRQRDAYIERDVKPDRKQRKSDVTRAKEAWKCENLEIGANQI